MASTMTKADIIEHVYEKVGGFSKKEAAEIVEVVFDTIKETLERGEKIKISGFGNFVVRDKNSRVGRNPQTGKEITISARRVLTFKPSQVLKNALNGEAPPTAAEEAANEANDDMDSEMDDQE
jgi:integration host factor subunit alpha